MSVAATTAVWNRHTTLSPVDKLLLLCLADCASDATGQCYPSIRLIVERTGLDRRTVQRRFVALEAAGLLRRELGGTVGSGATGDPIERRATTYAMLFEWEGKLSTAQRHSAAPPAAERRPPSGTVPPRPAAPRRPNHHIEPSFEPRAANANYQNEKPVSREEAAAALESIHRKLGSRRQKAEAVAP